MSSLWKVQFEFDCLPDLDAELHYGRTQSDRAAAQGKVLYRLLRTQPEEAGEAPRYVGGCGKEPAGAFDLLTKGCFIEAETARAEYLRGKRPVNAWDLAEIRFWGFAAGRDWSRDAMGFYADDPREMKRLLRAGVDLVQSLLDKGAMP